MLNDGDNLGMKKRTLEERSLTENLVRECGTRDWWYPVQIVQWGSRGYTFGVLDWAAIVNGIEYQIY